MFKPFLQHQALSLAFDEVPGQAEHHKYITTICLAYLTYDDIWQRYKAQKDSKRKYTFIDYAARYWNSHVTTAGKDDDELVSLVKISSVLKMGTFINGEERKGAAATPLYYAALFDLTGSMECIWAEDETQLDAIPPTTASRTLQLL
ncbi:hypothetical protein K469DRAFT_802582 [Zopfia rhizophila CBS 207.26]|uniref:Uncharacterized protein n=1 Tax=Zopfia rhizophila CBS 207.26 TaxID=1314779 RepID=A0A6A6DGU2_9PEZI|nr:hypothetical protein K469DRAFT_802582 [Zopfia rhizophila CBS 207.26]